MVKVKFNSLIDLFCFNVKYYRLKKNISQEELAELCSLSSRRITDIECYRSLPKVANWESLAKALEIKPYQLLQNPERNQILLYKMNNKRQYNQVK